MSQKKSILHIFFLFSVVTAFAATDGTSAFGALTDGHYTLSSQTYTLTEDVNTASYIYVPAGVTATIDLAGYTIDRGLTSEMTNGSVIIVEGSLTITDASTGGKIQGGYDAGVGYLYTTSCVKVLKGASFNLQGGTIIGRVQDCDYTVSVVENSNFTMTGGKITGGETGVLALGNVTLTGGEISGNSMGVRVGKNFSISGNPVITGNTVMNADLISTGVIRKINITDALTDGANIGITVLPPTDNSPVTVTSGYNTYNSVSLDTYFSLDNDGQIQTSPFDYMTVVMGWNEDRTEVAVGTALYTVNFDMNGHGDAIDAVSLLSGYKVAEPTEPTADEWFFVDWFTDDAYTAQWNFDNTVTSNMTLHARWTQEAIYSIILPENMVIVSTTNAPVGGKYPVGTEIKFKLSSEDYVVDGDVKYGDDVLTTDGDGIYTITMGDANLTITAMVKKAVEPNKTLSGSESYTAQDGDVLTGSTSGTVTIANNVKITLSDVTITGGIVCEGTADITLVGTNSVTGANLKAGIQIGGSGTTLTIKGNGSLNATGGSDAAGIGLSRAWDVDATGGDIVIEGGNITATGHDMGAGIGTGVSYGNGTDNTATIGNITIKGGTVKAIGGTNQSFPGSGIGKGGAYSNGHAVVGTITIYDDIDMVDASSISESIVYMHETTDVTESKADYFTISEDGNRRLIVQKPVIADIPDQTYTGSEITPEPLVIAGSLNLTKSTDYVYSYTNNTDAGTATVKATFQGDYASLGYVEKTFRIIKLLTHSDITITAIPDQTYSGSEICPEISVKDGETTLILGTDYTVECANNVSAGTANMTITGMGDYPGSVSKTFEISKAPLTVTAKNDTIVYGDDLSFAGVVYSGFIGEEDVSVLNGTLAYECKYDRGGAAGKYDVTPGGLTAENYDIEFVTGELTVEPKVVSIAWGEQTMFVYNGSEQIPTATAEGLLEGDNCELTVTGAAKNAGNYTATVTGLSNPNYKMRASDTKQDFEILKADPTMVKAPVAVENLVYSGKAQTLVVAGDAQNGVMVYKLEGADSYTDALPSATEAGDYTVYFMVRGDENYNDLKAQTLTATITAPASSSSVKESSSSVEESSSSVEIASSSSSSRNDVESSSSSNDESSSSVVVASSSSSSRNDVVSSSSRNDESSSSSSKEKKDGFAPVVASGLNVQFAHNELTVTAPTASEVKVYIFDLQGNLKQQYRGHSAGTHSVSFDHMNRGLYLVKVVSGSSVQTLRAQVK